jgi:hypothetical protein
VSGNDTAETESIEIRNEIVRLLNTPLRSSNFGGFQANAGAVAASSADYLSLASADYDTANALAAGTLNPSPGTVVHPGDMVRIEFTFGPASGIEGALFNLNGTVENMRGSGPFVVSYKIPSDRGGRIDILAIAYGSASTSYSASGYFLVVPEIVPGSLGVSPTDLRLDEAGQRYQVSVNGSLQDGSGIDLTRGTAGTSYALQSGTNRVATVSSDGLIEARGVGVETVLVNHEGTTYTVNLTVGSSAKPRILGASISGKKLFINGEGFDDGAKILLNGEQQKSANDENTPTTRLIGKKAGKKIARGETVVLTIRNSDGTLSNGFSFTRPL